MNKLHGSEEKRKHYLRQGGPKTSPNTGFTAHFVRSNASVLRKARKRYTPFCLGK